MLCVPLILSCRNSFHILSKISTWNIFSPSMWLFFLHFLMVSFKKQHFKIWINPNLTNVPFIFLLWFILFVVSLRNPCLLEDDEDFSSMLSSICFRILAFTYRSMIYLYFYVWHKVKIKVQYFYIDIQLFQHHYGKMYSFHHLITLDHCQKSFNHVCIENR